MACSIKPAYYHRVITNESLQLAKKKLFGLFSRITNSNVHRSQEGNINV